MRARLFLRPMFAMLVSGAAVSTVAAGCASQNTSEPGTGGASGTAGAATGGANGGTTTNGGTTNVGGTTAGTTSAGGTSGAGGTTPIGGTDAGGMSGASGVSGVGGLSGSAGDMGTGGVSGTAGDAGASGSAGAASGAGGAGGGAGGTGGAGAGGKAGGGSGGSGGMMNVMGPCDIYASTNPATPCVAAYSTVRRLRSAYTGPLYQVRRGAPDNNTGSGGTTQDIPQTANGFADAAAQNAFCGTQTCSVSILYDQSGRNNNLTVAKGGCYEGSASEDDYESDAKRRPLTVGGNNVYALYMDKHDGYRNTGTRYPTEGPAGAGMPTGSQEQGVYMVAEGSGRRPGAGCCCCWNFGNGSRNNCYGPTGQMNALFLGTGYWGSGAGNGPWFMGDFEAGVWAGGSGASNVRNMNLPSMTMNYAFGILKTRSNNYAIRVGDATTGNLTTAYDGNAPAQWSMEGAIILGIGGDNSNSSDGTFLEGAITAGRPTDATDALVHENVKALRYGQ